jgi:hypothetical protein
VETARTLAARLAVLPRGTDYLLIGDFNENYNEGETFQTAGFDNTRGVCGVNHVLGTARSRPDRSMDYVCEEELVRCSGVCHYDLWLELDEAARGSHRYRGRWETPDHILLPAALYDSAGISYRDNSFEVVTLGGRLLRGGEPYRWQMRYRGKEKYHRGEGYSDHLPIRARFVRSPFVPGTSSVAPRAAADNDESLNTLGFESGVEGWIGVERGVDVSRDTSGPRSGRYCLRVEGEVGARNATVAMARLARRLLPREAPKSVSLWVKGRGTVSLRLRQAGGGKWRYFNAPTFASSKSARYQHAEWPSWTELSLRAAGAVSPGTDMDLEIRAKKQTTLRLWLDAVAVR